MFKNKRISCIACTMDSELHEVYVHVCTRACLCPGSLLASRIWKESCTSGAISFSSFLNTEGIQRGDLSPRSVWENYQSNKSALAGLSARIPPTFPLGSFLSCSENFSAPLPSFTSPGGVIFKLFGWLNIQYSSPNRSTMMYEKRNDAS